MGRDVATTDERVLVTDAERDLAVTRLRDACVDGRLTLAEFSERTEAALAARSRVDLAPLTADIDIVEQALPTPAARRSFTKWLVALLGSSRQRGRWRVAETSNAVAVMGSCEVDLRRAEMPGPEVTITAVSLMGEVKVIVPPGVRVDLSGVAIMGERDSNVDDDRPLPGGPVIRVQAFALMGAVRVQSKQ